MNGWPQTIFGPKHLNTHLHVTNKHFMGGLCYQIQWIDEGLRTIGKIDSKNKCQNFNVNQLKISKFHMANYDIHMRMY
jgi:hypothetical protein